MMIVDGGGSAPVALGGAGDALGGSAPVAHRTKYTYWTKSIKDRQPPSLEEVQLYFRENWYKSDVAIKAHKFYDIANWHDSNWKKVLNRKQKMQSVRFKDENKLAVVADNQKAEEVRKQKQEQFEKEQEEKKRYLLSQVN